MTTAYWNILLALVISYLIGAIPAGWLVVKIANGKDVRLIGSGRTGGTNAMRAAGWLAGVITAGLDVLKGVATLWVVQWLAPGDVWVKVLAATLSVIGHNYSIFLLEKRAQGGIVFRGGAGGATCLGGSIALFPFSGFIILPTAILVFLGIGYASVTTISIAAVSLIIFVVSSLVEGTSWVYILYGVASLALVLWALRPNLERLRAGTERMVGLRAYFLKKKQNKTTGS